MEKKQITKIECKCDYCGQIFYRAPSKMRNSKSGLVFCCRTHKDMAQRLNSGKQFDAIRPNHYTILNDDEDATVYTYRLAAFRAFPHQCAICNWNEDEDILQVHHIDENRKNNSLDNLIILCPICHAKLSSHKYQLINKQSIIKRE